MAELSLSSVILSPISSLAHQHMLPSATFHRLLLILVHQRRPIVQLPLAGQMTAAQLLATLHLAEP